MRRTGLFFFSSRRRHTRCSRDWSSDVCSSDLIKALFVDFNSIVKKGQVVARIDPDIFEAKVNQAKADLDSAKAAVLNQQAQIERSRADVDNARASHAEAKAQTAKAQVAVVDTKRDLDRKTELFARQLIAKSDLDS